jgi:hypothetical protein
MTGQPIETRNLFAVAMTGDGRITILLPPRGPMIRADALNLAAYLVAMSQSAEGPSFEEVLAAVVNT